MQPNPSINTDASDTAACAGYVRRWASIMRRVFLVLAAWVLPVCANAEAVTSFDTSCFGGGVTKVPEAINAVAQLRCVSDGVLLEARPPLVWLHEFQGPFSFGARKVGPHANHSGNVAFSRLEGRRLTANERSSAYRGLEQHFRQRFPNDKESLSDTLGPTDAYIVSGTTTFGAFDIVLLVSSTVPQSSDRGPFKNRGWGFFVATCSEQSCEPSRPPFLIGEQVK